MQVVKAQEELLEFNDGSKFISDWERDCCEHNYADFSVITLDPEIMGNEFSKVTFGKVVDKAGFILKFHGLPHPVLGTYTKKVFIPCYSEQNGYYTIELSVSRISKKGNYKKSINLNCEGIY